jgi:transposase
LKEVKIKKKKVRKNEPNIGIQKLAVELTGGIDISVIEGIGLSFILTIIAETGLDLKDFPTGRQFSSWLQVCPDLRKTGGKVISNKTKRGKNRLAKAFMYSANAIGNMKEGEYLVHFFKRIQRKKGRAVAITATANKLSKIIWNMLVKKLPYQPIISVTYKNKIRHNQIKNIQKKIRELNIQDGELQFAAA